MCCIVLISALQKKPEEINRRSSDMWSFAILLWELVTREVPFADLSNMEIGMKVGRPLHNSMCILNIARVTTRLTPCLRVLSGGPGGSEAYHPTWNITTYLQAYEDMHEWRPGKEAQVWYDCANFGEDAGQIGKLESFRALLYWTRSDNCSCGADQYCLKILPCCCIQGHCSFSFWEKFSSSHIFIFFNF